MRNLFIPALGTNIVLAKSWTFDLYGEYRNESMFDFLRIESPPYIASTYTPDKIAVIIPQGSDLRIDRIYVRNGQSEYNSVTFTLKSWAGEKFKGKGRVRFWAKLHDVNNILIDEVLTEEPKK